MIVLEKVTKRYGTTTVVDAVSMTIERGTITVIVGTSGSGKSTLLRMINRLVEPTEGRILIQGRDTAAEAPHLLRRRIGYAIQSHGLFPHRTVAENIGIVPRLVGWTETRVRERVHELLEVFQLDPQVYAGKFPHQLSGGQQQRVGVARALAAEPEVLLMDEPFGALDPVIRAKAQDDLLGIQRRFRTTVILVTHDIDEAFRLGDRVAVMSAGRLLQFARPAQLLTEPADPLVARMTGEADRGIRLLSLTLAGEALRAAGSNGGLAVEGEHPEALAAGTEAGSSRPAPDPAVREVSAEATLRDVLSELLWSGATCAIVVDADGHQCGRLTIADILSRGRPV